MSFFRETIDTEEEILHDKRLTICFVESINLYLCDASAESEGQAPEFLFSFLL